MAAGRERPAVLQALHRHQDLVIELGLLLAVEVLILAALAPASALRNVLPYGSDHTGHPYNVSELAANLRHFRLTGWSQGWFDGFPTGVLYPVLAPVVAAIGSLVIPLAVAYKLTVLAGPLLLPVCAYLAGRLAGLPRAYPVLLAVFSAPFLFDVSCNICGGPIESTMLGEYAYSWGLALGVLSLGATARLCDGRGSRWWPALLLGLTMLAHPVTALWTAAGIALIFGYTWLIKRRPPGSSLVPLALAALLAAVWWLPFLADRQYMPEPLQGKLTQYLSLLFPASGPWEVVLTALAAGGAYWAIRNRQPFLVALTGITVLAALGTRFLPVNQLPNWRVLELWLAGCWLLAAVGCVEGVRWLVSRMPSKLRERQWVSDGRVRYAVAGGALLAVALAQGVPWGLWPGEQFRSGKPAHERWLGLDFPAVPQARFAGHVFGGALANPGGKKYEAMVAMLKGVARTHGCGRVALDENYYGGTPRFYDELDSLPLITSGCLSTLMGTLADSGDNVPAILFAESEASSYPLMYMPHIPYPKFDLSAAVADLRLLGAKYYLTHGGEAEAAARLQPDLSLAGSTAAVQVWEISDATLVTALSYKPVVVRDLAGKATWVQYYLDYELSTEWGHVLEAQSGPPSWPTALAGHIPPAIAQPPVKVSDVSVNGSVISFTVSRVGVPVEVRDTYFPGWQVHGGTGPYRAMPDFMVVVPTSHHVTLTYTTTAIITTADVLGGLGLAGILVLGITDRRRRRVTPAPATVPSAKGGKPPRDPVAKVAEPMRSGAKTGSARAPVQGSARSRSGAPSRSSSGTATGAKKKTPSRPGGAKK